MQSLVIGILPQTKMESLTLPKALMSVGQYASINGCIASNEDYIVNVYQIICLVKVMAILIQTWIQVLPQT